MLACVRPADRTATARSAAAARKCAARAVFKAAHSSRFSETPPSPPSPNINNTLGPGPSLRSAPLSLSGGLRGMGRGQSPRVLHTHNQDNNPIGKRCKYNSNSSSSGSNGTNTTSTITTDYYKNMVELRAEALVEGLVQPCKRLLCKTSPCDVQFVKRRKLTHIA